MTLRILDYLEKLKNRILVGIKMEKRIRCHNAISGAYFDEAMSVFLGLLFDISIFMLIITIINIVI